MTIKKITGQESPTQRYNIINDFTLGLTQSLVAIKVLDEGVDLPVSDAAACANQMQVIGNGFNAEVGF